MERKGGFKECSRCGLRNKPTARQCDFCGQRFEEEDKWEQQIDALESLNKNEGRADVSDDMSRRIESTIVKKDAVERKDRPVEPVSAIGAVAAASAVSQMKPEVADAKPVIEPVSAPEPTPQPLTVNTTVPASSVEETVLVEDIEPLTDEPVDVAVTETVLDIDPMGTKRPRFFSWSFNPRSRRDVAFLLILQGGIVVYLATLLVSSGSLESVGQWGLTMLSATMITAGLGKLAINWDLQDLKPENFVIKEVVVEICPRCHERVAAQDSKCPACGTEFEPMELRGAA